MKRFRLGTIAFWALVLAVVLGSAGWLLGAFNRRDREPLPPDTTAARDPSAVVVTLQPVTVRPVQRTVEAVGTLWGYEEVEIKAKVEGRVLKRFHEVMDRVRPGEPLAEIDPTDYELAVKQAEKALQVELAHLGLAEPPGTGFEVATVPAVVQARLKMENARTRSERAQAARIGVSAEEAADRLTDYRVAQSGYEKEVMTVRAGLATVQMKQAALAIARQQRKDALVTVPEPTHRVPGLEGGVFYAVTHRAVDEGALVRSGADLFKLVIDRTLKLRVPVPERYTTEVRVAQKAQVATASRPEPYDGTVALINPAVDPITRTFNVEIQVPNPDSGLKSGSFAKAAIQTRLDSEAAVVPLEALISFAGITKIFLDEAGKAREVQVTTGVQTTEWVEIRTPTLPRGARVVTSGHANLADGTPIVPRAGKEVSAR